MIKDICKKFGIENYTINDDGTVDVDGNVNLGNKGLTKLPIKFRNVSGYFDCRNNQLITLEGGPRTVGRDFSCGNNQLITLEGGPRTVGRDFSCGNNQLITLEGGPQRVGRDFYCNHNQLGGEYKGLYRSEEYSLLIKRINRDKKLKELGI